MFSCRTVALALLVVSPAGAQHRHNASDDALAFNRVPKIPPYVYLGTRKFFSVNMVDRDAATFSRTFYANDTEIAGNETIAGNDGGPSVQLIDYYYSPVYYRPDTYATVAGDPLYRERGVMAIRFAIESAADGGRALYALMDHYAASCYSLEPYLRYGALAQFDCLGGNDCYYRLVRYPAETRTRVSWSSAYKRHAVPDRTYTYPDDLYVYLRNETAADSVTVLYDDFNCTSYSLIVADGLPYYATDPDGSGPVVEKRFAGFATPYLDTVCKKKTCGGLTIEIFRSGAASVMRDVTNTKRLPDRLTSKTDIRFAADTGNASAAAHVARPNETTIAVRAEGDVENCYCTETWQTFRSFQIFSGWAQYQYYFGK